MDTLTVKQKKMQRKKKVETNLTYFECRHVWKKIIANKEAYENEIIHNALQVNLKGRIRDSKFIIQVFPQSPDIKKLQHITKIAKIQQMSEEITSQYHEREAYKDAA